MKKIIATILSAVATVVCFTAVPLSANNNSDVDFSFKLPAYYYYKTTTEGEYKEDTSPTYVHFYDHSSWAVGEYGVQFSVHGGNSVYKVSENCTCGGTSCIIYPDSHRRIHQNVKEWGYSYAFLGTSAPNSLVAGKTIYGQWSPDSTGSSPFAN